MFSILKKSVFSISECNFKDIQSFYLTDCSGENDTQCYVAGKYGCVRDSRCDKVRQCDSGIDEEGCGMCRLADVNIYGNPSACNLLG